MATYSETGGTCELCGHLKTVSITKKGKARWYCTSCLQARRNAASILANTKHFWIKDSYEDVEPTDATEALPGSPEKIAVLCRRVERGEQLAHPKDVDYSRLRYSPRARLQEQEPHYVDEREADQP